MSRDDRAPDLDAILKRPTERLGPPEGSWERVARRARRRKAAKATLSIAAGVAVIAGAVPAVIAVRHSSDNETLAITRTPPPNHPTGSTPSPSPGVVSALSGFLPESLSFVSQTVGYLWGSAGTSQRGVVAKTINGGRSWSRLPSPPVNNALVGDRGAAQIRFATGDVGFVYGTRNFLTQDGGQSWIPFAAHGYIADLEAMQGRIWALVRNCQHCRAVRLYSSTAADPVALRPVHQVPVMHGLGGAPEVAGAASIAVSGNHVDVIVGHSAFWSSPDGKRWTQRRDPCPAGAGGVRSALVTSTDTLGVVVACGYNVSGSNQSKRLFASSDSGTHWQSLATEPAPQGYLQTLSAGSPSDIIVGTSRGGAQMTHDSGAHWSATPPGAATKLSFVGFIYLTHIVAVADPLSSVGSFATSTDAGRHWTFKTFP